MALTQFEFCTLWSERTDPIRHLRVRGIGQGKAVDLLDWSDVVRHRPYHQVGFVRNFWPKQLELTIQTKTGMSTVHAFHEPLREGPGEAFIGSFNVFLRKEGGLVWAWSAGRGYGEDVVRVVQHPTP